MKQKVISGIVGFVIFSIFTLCMISINSDFFDKKETKVSAGESHPKDDKKEEAKDKFYTKDDVSVYYNEDDFTKDEDIQETRYANTSVNVRENDDTNSMIIATLVKNQKVDVTGKTSTGWYKINYHGSTGYVKGEYLNKEKVSTTSNTDSSDNNINNSNSSSNNYSSDYNYSNNTYSDDSLYGEG